MMVDMIGKYKIIRQAAKAARNVSGQLSGLSGAIEARPLSGSNTKYHIYYSWPTALLSGGIKFKLVAAGPGWIHSKYFCDQFIEAMYAYQIPGENLYMCLFATKSVWATPPIGESSISGYVGKVSFREFEHVKGMFSYETGSKPVWGALRVYTLLLNQNQYIASMDMVKKSQKSDDGAHQAPIILLAIPGVTQSIQRSETMGDVQTIFAPHSVVISKDRWRVLSPWGVPPSAGIGYKRSEYFKYTIYDNTPALYLSSSVDLVLARAMKVLGEWKAKFCKSCNPLITKLEYADIKPYLQAVPLIESGNQDFMFVGNAVPDVLMAAEPYSIAANANIHAGFKAWAGNIVAEYKEAIEQTLDHGMLQKDIPSDLISLVKAFYPKFVLSAPTPNPPAMVVQPSASAFTPLLPGAQPTSAASTVQEASIWGNIPWWAWAGLGAGALLLKGVLKGKK